MAKKKKPIQLELDQDLLFRKLYVQWRIPRGQYKSHPDYLDEFTQDWNRLSGRSDNSVDVLHYMDTKQKQTKRLHTPWPKFDGAHKRLEPVEAVFGADAMAVLKDIYLEIVIPLDVGTEGLIYHEDILHLLTKEFAKQTGFGVPGMLLAARIEHERKGGSWVTLREHGKSDLGFDDLDAIAAM